MMAKASTTEREYVILRIAEDLEGLGRRFWEDLGVESASNPTEARAIARSRFPEDKQAGVYVAVALGGFAPKAGGRRRVWVDDETDVDLGPAKPPLHRDADGNLPLAGQTDLAETLEHEPAAPGEPTAGRAKVKDAAPEAAETPSREEVVKAVAVRGEPDGTPITDIPEVEPTPVTIVPDPAPEGASTQAPALAPPTPEEVAQAKAAREERVRENARRYAESKAAGEAAQAPDRAAAAAAVAARTSAEVATDLAATEAARVARVAAEKAAARDETPPPVNADSDWGDPAAADNGWGTP